MILYCDHQFPTFVVGSLPRPQWVRDLIEDRKKDKITWREADYLLDSAVPSAIRLQERAGLDFVSDGEWRRENYVKVIAEAVDGFQADAFYRHDRTRPGEYAVTRRMSQHRPLVTGAAAFLKAGTTRRLIVAVPSPFIVGQRMWHQKFSLNAYPSRAMFMEACVPIIRKEIGRLLEMGIDQVQIDDPELLMLVDPDYRARMGIRDMEKAKSLAIRMINAVSKGHDEDRLSLHMCHAHFNRRRSTTGSYEPIIELLGDIRVRRFAMEFAANESEGIEVLARFPKDKVLGLGVIDHCSSNVESPAEVVGKVESALAYITPDRITLNPDCGFSPSSVNPMDLDEAYKKLKSMCAAADILRGRHEQ